MKLRWLIVLLLAPSAAVAAEPTYQAIAAQLEPAAGIEFPPLDTKALEAEDALTDKLAGLPRRFAVGRDLDLTPQIAGEWRQAKNGDWVWHLAVHAAGAAHLNFGFARFDLPPGAELRILGETDPTGLGPYTERDELPHGQLWTAVLTGEHAILQLTVPAAQRKAVVLQLKRVGQGYRGFGASGSTCKSGSCNTDVACLASSDPWNEPRRAVGAYTRGGIDTCTGSLLNNTRNDRRMLFATAGHCRISDTAAAASVLVYWNYESPTCRTPGSPESGVALSKPSSTTAGLRFLAATDAIDGGGSLSTRSDWTLLELATPAAGNNFNLFWAGWDRAPPPSTCAAPASATSTAGLCASIHHPAVDEKRITFVEQPLTLTSYPSASLNLHWDARWDPTPPLLPNIQPAPSSLPPSVTEQGSSGSPLYNAERRMVGVLSGGPSICGATGESLRDYYGGLFHAWEGLGTPTTRMRDYLDPDNSGVTRIDGVGATPSLSVQLASAAFSAPPNAGDTVELTASASGGNGSYSYDWDTDDDGIYDRSGSAATVRLTYPKAYNASVRARARDSAGATGTTSRTLQVRAAVLTATAGTASQVCGDNDAAIEPGERWRMPVTLRNAGDATLPSGARALFVPSAASSGVLPIGPNGFGYRATTSSQGSCGYAFVDIAGGANAVAALSTVAVNNSFGPLDDARTTNNIALGGGGFKLYGQTYPQAVMSTNGYVSFSTAESGGDFSNDCTGGYNNGAVGPSLRAQHGDLVVGTVSGAGLRYRYFAACPRGAESDPSAPQGCHVFQWNRMQVYTGSTSAPIGDFDFQAIAYERSGQVAYQYRSAAPATAPGPTIGISNPSGNDPLNAACQADTAQPALSAICIFEPSALPSSGSSGLRLESPTLAVPSLAPGQLATVEVPFAIATSGSCASTLGLDYIGTAASTSFSLDTKTLLQTTLGGGGACQTSNACPAQIPAIATRSGLYYNPLRSGNGLANFIYGNLFGGLWYTAQADRSPTWYAVTGPYADHLGTTPILRFRNAGAPSGFLSVNEEVGRAWIAQIDSDSLMYAWTLTGSNSGMELMDATPLPFTSPNHSQTWYYTSESGWGLSIESLLLAPNSFLEFMVAYIYDSAGTARWVLGDSNSITAGSLNMVGVQAHCPACPRYNDWDANPLPAGSMTRTYTGPMSATLSTAITLPAPLNGTWNRNNVPLVTIGVPANSKRDDTGDGR